MSQALSNEVKRQGQELIRQRELIERLTATMVAMQQDLETNYARKRGPKAEPARGEIEAAI